MTVKEFQNMIEVRRDFDFTYQNKRYMVNARRGEDGSLKIDFGEEFCAKEHYDSVTHLLSDAKIGVRNLRDVLSDIR